MTRLLVCGGRDLDESAVADWLRLNAEEIVGSKITLVIHGDYRGADKGADRWARSARIQVKPFPADWKCKGLATGPERNSRMLIEGAPDIVIAFEGNEGTADMCRKARLAGLRVIEAVLPK